VPHTGSEARSKRKPKSALAGATPTSPEKSLRELLDRVWRSELRCKSDFARLHAEIVAMAASLNLISTKTGSNQFASAWLLTNKGLTWLQENA
jgi:hypothetical protein